MTTPRFQLGRGLPPGETHGLALFALPFLALAAAVWLTSGEYGRGLVSAGLGVVLLAVSVVQVRRFWRDLPTREVQR